MNRHAPRFERHTTPDGRLVTTCTIPGCTDPTSPPSNSDLAHAAWRKNHVAAASEETK